MIKSLVFWTEVTLEKADFMNLITSACTVLSCVVVPSFDIKRPSSWKEKQKSGLNYPIISWLAEFFGPFKTSSLKMVLLTKF